MKRWWLLISTNFAILIVLGLSMTIAQTVFGFNIQNTSGLLVFSLLFGFGGAFLSLALSKIIAKWTTKATVIDVPKDNREKWLVDTVRRQAEKAGIKMPEVAIYPGQEINAFATGPSRNNSLVAVSEGLLNNMTMDEAEAVLAHEVSHVANGDMVTMTLLQGVLNTFVFFAARVVGGAIDRSFFRSESGRGPGYFITVILAEFVFGLLASMIAMAFSRYREFRADEGGAQLAGRHKMIAALEKLNNPSASAAEAELPKAIAAFGINGRFSSLFSSHPPLEKRIEALKNSVVG